MRYLVQLGAVARELEVELAFGADGSLKGRLAGDSPWLEIEIRDRPHGRTLLIGGRVLDVIAHGPGPDIEAWVGGRRLRAAVESEQSRRTAARSSQTRSSASGTGTLLSPMPGKIVKVCVAVGDDVEEGAPLIVIEAMKMENELLAGRAGTVAEIYVNAGVAVESSAKLIRIK